MIKDLILRYSTRRATLKLTGVIAGVLILGFCFTEKLTVLHGALWIAAPLILLWLNDVGSAAEQRRYAELLKQNPAKEDPSALLWEGGDASLVRFFRELISLSIWPFYLILFALIYFGGEKITKANREAFAQTELKSPSPGETVPLSYQQSSVPFAPIRATGVPFNRMNPAMQRSTPSPFRTPPRFPMSNRPPTTPVKTFTPASSPNSPSAPAVKGP